MCYKCKVEYYSSTKKIGIPNSAAKLVDLQVIMLNKINQTERILLCYFFIIVSLKISNLNQSRVQRLREQCVGWIKKDWVHSMHTICWSSSSKIKDKIILIRCSEEDAKLHYFKLLLSLRLALCYAYQETHKSVSLEENLECQNAVHQTESELQSAPTPLPNDAAQLIARKEFVEDWLVGRLFGRLQSNGGMQNSHIFLPSCVQSLLTVELLYLLLATDFVVK